METREKIREITLQTTETELLAINHLKSYIDNDFAPCKVLTPMLKSPGALQMMRKHNITTLLVVDDNNYKGVVHLHDILKEGII